MSHRTDLCAVRQDLHDCLDTIERIQRAVPAETEARRYLGRARGMLAATLSQVSGVLSGHIDAIDVLDEPVGGKCA